MIAAAPSCELTPMSLDRDLERLRLEQRARRLDAVIRELRARAGYRAARGGEVPAPLRGAIQDLHAELVGIERRLGGRRGARSR